MTAIASNMVRQGLNAFIEEVQRQDNPTTEEVRQLLASLDFPIFFLDRLWVLANGFLDCGMEESQLQFLFKGFRDVTGIGYQSLHRRQRKNQNREAYGGRKRGSFVQAGECEPALRADVRCVV